MAVDVGSATGYLDLDITGFLSGLRSAQDEANKSANSIEKIGSKFVAVGDKIAGVGKKLTTAVTVPIVGIATAAVTTTAKFESAMSQIQATMGITADSMTDLNGATVNTMDVLSGLAKEMGATTKFSAAEAAEAINNMAMAGYSVEQIFAALPGVLNLASAGALDLDYATQLAANGLNVMGLGVESLDEMADKMAVTASNAYGSVTDFGEGLLVAGGQAKLANLSLTDTYTALGILGDNGLSASEGGTMLRNTLKNLYTPTDAAASALKALGVETQTANGELIDIQTVLKTLKNSLDGLTEGERIHAMSQIFDTRTIAGANALLENSSDRWDELSAAIDNADGAAQRMADTQLDNLSGQLTILKSGLEGLAIAFGELLLPMIKSIVGKIQELTDWLNNLDESQKQQIIKIAAIAAAVGPLLLVVGKLVSGIGNLIIKIGKIPDVISGAKTAFAAIKVAIAGVSVPVVAVVAVIGLLVTAFVNLWKTNEEFRNKMTAIWDGIKQSFSDFVLTAKEKLSSLEPLFNTIVGIMSTIWQRFTEILAPVFEGAFSAVAKVLDAVLGVILGILDVFVGIFTWNWTQVWQGIKNIASSIWGAIKDVISTALGVIRGIFDAVLAWFGSLWATVWGAIKDFFVNTWNNIVAFFQNIVSTITTAVSTFVTNVISFFSNLPYNIGVILGTVIATVAQWVANMVTKAVEIGTNFVNSIITFFTELPVKISEFLSEAIANVTAWAVEFPQKAAEAASNFISNVVSFISGLPGQVSAFLSETISNLAIWVVDMGTKGEEAITSLISNVVDGAKAIPSKMAEIGKNIVDGVWSGIKNAASWFTDQVTGFFDGIVGGVKKVLGIGSPSKVFAKEVGRWLPAGVAQGFETAMPAAMRDMQDALNDGIDSIDANDIDVNAEASVTSFADRIKGIYDSVATWFESVESRVINSVDSMTETLAAFMAAGQTMVNPDGTLGYVGFNGFTRRTPTLPTPGRTSNQQQGGGDTFNFYSNKSISEVEAARLLKKTKRDMAEGF